MKKILIGIVMILTMVSVISLAGCGNKDDAESGDDAKKQTATEGVLVVGLDDTFAPMGFRDEKGDLVGFDVDLAKAVGEELGMEVEFRPISWSAKDMELKSKNIDCIWNGMSVTPERIEAMSLSNKYLDNEIVIMKEKADTNTSIKSEADLKKYKIGTQAESAGSEILKGKDEYDSFKENITEYEDYDKALLDLKAGRIDAIAIDRSLGEYKNKNLKGTLEVCDYSLGDDAYAIGFRKEDTALRDAVNDAIKNLIDNGKAEKISSKWFDKNIVIFEEIK